MAKSSFVLLVCCSLAIFDIFSVSDCITYFWQDFTSNPGKEVENKTNSKFPDIAI